MHEPEPEPSTEDLHPTAHHDGFGGALLTGGARVALAVAVGVLAGLSSAFFLVVLNWATDTREDHPWFLWLLPIIGLGIGAIYHYGGKSSAEGNNLVLDEIHEPRSWIPRRQAVLVYVGTIATHLFGGSAGREGTAIQMSGSLTDALNRIVRVTGRERRILLLAAIGGGFSAVFGVPFAGIVFAMEVQRVGRLRWVAMPSIAIAAFVGNAVVHALGVEHTPYPEITGVHLSPGLVGKVVVAGVVCGVVSVLFAVGTHRFRRVSARLVGWPPLRPFLGGAMVIALTYLVGDRSYLGLSIPLITTSLAGGAGVVLGAFALKGLFTIVTLGSGFQGGEVTPLFVIGATLGVTLGHALGVPIPLMAALGFVAVFAGATNTPIACTVMGVELFGWDPALLLGLACGVSYVCSGSSSIYTSQRRMRWGFRHQQPDELPVD